MCVVFWPFAEMTDVWLTKNAHKLNVTMFINSCDELLNLGKLVQMIVFQNSGSQPF